MCVSKSERVLVVYVCVRVLGESRALYIMAKECMSVEWSVDESSKVEGES